MWRCRNFHQCSKLRELALPFFWKLTLKPLWLAQHCIPAKKGVYTGETELKVQKEIPTIQNGPETTWGRDDLFNKWCLDNQIATVNAHSWTHTPTPLHTKHGNHCEMHCRPKIEVETKELLEQNESDEKWKWGFKLNNTFLDGSRKLQAITTTKTAKFKLSIILSLKTKVPGFRVQSHKKKMKLQSMHLIRNAHLECRKILQNLIITRYNLKWAGNFYTCVYNMKVCVRCHKKTSCWWLWG